MKAKTLWTLATAFFMAMSLASCGGDDENNSNPNDPDNPDNPSTGTEGLDKESQEIIEKYADFREWIGRWEYTGAANYLPDWIFMPDGTVFRDDSGWTSGGDVFGSWQYDKESKTLATTLNWTWEITIQTPTAWSGIRPGNGNTYSYARGWWSDPNDELLIGTWVGEENNVSLTFTADGRCIIEDESGKETFGYSTTTEHSVYWTEYRQYAVMRDIFLDKDEETFDHLDIDQLDGYRMVVEDASYHEELVDTYIYSTFAE